MPSVHVGAGTHLRLRRCAYRPARTVGTVAHVHRRPRGRGPALPSGSPSVAGAGTLLAGAYGVPASPAHERFSFALAGVPRRTGAFHRNAGAAIGVVRGRSGIGGY